MTRVSERNASTRRRGLLIGAVAPVALLAAACSGQAVTAPEGVEQHWVDVIEDVLRNNPSELERQILADFHVTDEELREAQQAHVQCAAERGVQVTHHRTGTDVTPIDHTLEQDEMNEIHDHCAQGTTSNISVIHDGMRHNPRGLTLHEMWRECFDKHGLPYGQGIDDQELSELIFSGYFDPADDQGALCAVDPMGETQQTAEQARRTLYQYRYGELVTVTLDE